MTVDQVWTDEVDSYLAALERGDRSEALGQVRALHGEGHDVLTLIQRLLAPAQLRVGELWVSDAWSVAQEHAATAISESVLTSLAVERELHAAQLPADAPTLIVSCVEQEWHALPALMVTEHLRAEGFGVSYLGANASAHGLVRHVHELGPRAVLLSCSLSAFLPLVRRQVEAVRETGTPVVVGGAAFDADGRRAAMLGATGFVTSATGVVDLVRGLPDAVPPAPPLTHPGAEEAFVVFGERETFADDIERRLLARLPLEGVDPDRREPAWLRVLDDQLPHVVGAIAGALVTDDPEIVRHALVWASAVLQHRDAPAEVGPALREALRGALHQLPEASRMLAAAQDAPPAS
jgi:MerR family transcriptional regulator, light-induced transcriptional regulator